MVVSAERGIDAEPRAAAKLAPRERIGYVPRSRTPCFRLFSLLSPFPHVHAARAPESHRRQGDERRPTGCDLGVAAGRGRVARGDRALRLRRGADADRGADAALRPLDRRGHRHRREGDVHLRRQGRGHAHAAPRGHGRRGARLRRARGAHARADHEVELPRAHVPPRAPRARALSAVLAGGPRVLRRSRAARRRRDDRDGRLGAEHARRDRRRGADQLARLGRRARALSRRARRVPHAAP